MIRSINSDFDKIILILTDSGLIFGTIDSTPVHNRLYRCRVDFHGFYHHNTMVIFGYCYLKYFNHMPTSAIFDYDTQFHVLNHRLL